MYERRAEYITITIVGGAEYICTNQSLYLVQYEAHLSLQTQTNKLNKARYNYPYTSIIIMLIICVNVYMCRQHPCWGGSRIVERRGQAARSGLGACPPGNILSFRRFEIDSGAFWDTFSRQNTRSNIRIYAYTSHLPLHSVRKQSQHPHVIQYCVRPAWYVLDSIPLVVNCRRELETRNRFQTAEQGHADSKDTLLVNATAFMILLLLLLQKLLQAKGRGTGPLGSPPWIRPCPDTPSSELYWITQGITQGFHRRLPRPNLVSRVWFYFRKSCGGVRHHQMCTPFSTIV